MKPGDLAAASTIVGVVARQLTELHDAVEVGDHATARALRLKIATTAPLAIEALRTVLDED